MNTKENLNKFLEELSELSNKYGLIIGGCGCCGSPWVAEIEIDGGVITDFLEFDGSKYTASV